MGRLAASALRQRKQIYLSSCFRQRRVRGGLWHSRGRQRTRILEKRNLDRLLIPPGKISVPKPSDQVFAWRGSCGFLPCGNVPVSMSMNARGRRHPHAVPLSACSNWQSSVTRAHSYRAHDTRVCSSSCSPNRAGAACSTAAGTCRRLKHQNCRRTRSGPSSPGTRCAVQTNENLGRRQGRSQRPGKWEHCGGSIHLLP